MAHSIDELMGERVQQNCARHGAYMAQRVGLVTKRPLWTGCEKCLVENEAMRRARQTQADALEQFNARLADCGMPVRFKDKSLDNFRVDTDAQRYALTVARDYAENFAAKSKRGDGLIFSGMPGTGKSHLATAILRSAICTRTGRYATCMGAIREVRDTWRKDSEKSESSVLEAFGSVGLLVLDEIGVQYGTDGEQTIIFDILDRRYRDMRPTILITNQDQAGLKTFIGERTFDRLTETCRWIPFDWPSYRPVARKEASA